ncbi:hypothetical protein BT69DRAFT_1337078 [Atractiella rhizophila]|nr:hypothetical protein BT69DRAFT_1337078 [Atractiella rhizophila]
MATVQTGEMYKLGEIVSEFIDNSDDWVTGELDPALGINFNEGLVEGFILLHLQEQVANQEWEHGHHIMEESDGDEAFNYQMDNLDSQSSDEDADFEAVPAWTAISFAGNNAPTTRAAIEELEEYFPYPNKPHMYGDILLNFLRNDISEPLRAVLWKMIPEMGMENAPKATLPSKGSMRIFAEKMRAVGVGAETKEYRGHRGNLVYLNDLPAMIAEAIANPLICQHLTFLPENTPNQLQEIYQAEKWLEELNPHLLTPCFQYRSSLFFTYEVTELEGG